MEKYDFGAACSGNKLWVSDERSKHMNCIIDSPFNIFQDVSGASSEDNSG